MAWKDHYLDPQWQFKKAEILNRDGWECSNCKRGLFDRVPLHVHHAKYQGKPWEVDSGYLQTLCFLCHYALGPHPKGGVYWANTGMDHFRAGHCPRCKSGEFSDCTNMCYCHDCDEPIGPLFMPGDYNQLAIDVAKNVEAREQRFDLQGAIDYVLENIKEKV